MARACLRCSKPIIGRRVDAIYCSRYCGLLYGQAARTRHWRERNPEKWEAHKAVKSALERGELERQPCEVCGGRAESHHDDYSRPLDVRWLCREHHRRAHAA